MESSDQYNFSIFQPRNRHGRKNRNVILSMLVIWAVAVFGFQILLKILEKPSTEATLGVFEASWPALVAEQADLTDYQAVLKSLLLVQGKNNSKPDDKQVLADAMSLTTFRMVPDSLEPIIQEGLIQIKALKAELPGLEDQAYLTARNEMFAQTNAIINLISPYGGFLPESLEATILTGNLDDTYPASFHDASFERLPDIMKFYLTHNQSVLTNTKFLGFPFHYFYTGVFLLVLFVVLCIAYNLLIEWRLKKEHITE